MPRHAAAQLYKNTRAWCMRESGKACARCSHKNSKDPKQFLAHTLAKIVLLAEKWKLYNRIAFVKKIKHLASAEYVFANVGYWSISVLQVRRFCITPLFNKKQRGPFLPIQITQGKCCAAGRCLPTQAGVVAWGQG